ncbi:MAG: ferritin-like domain-containing protein [Nakamurella sp.]
MTAPTTPAASDSSAGGSPDASVSVVPGSGAVVTTQVDIGAVEGDAAQAVQVGLGTAHAAVWAYGLISAYDTEDLALVRRCRLSNEQIRDSTSDLLSSVGVDPIATEVAYRLPLVVTDRATALQAAVAIEHDATNAWRAVVGSTGNYQLRRFALTALSDSAVRLTGWRVLAGVIPSTVPFPGNEPG